MVKIKQIYSEVKDSEIKLRDNAHDIDMKTVNAYVKQTLYTTHVCFKLQISASKDVLKTFYMDLI